MINYQDGNGSTPTYVAPVNDHSSVTEYLIHDHCNRNTSIKVTLDMSL
jgi:hypothetical protein